MYQIELDRQGQRSVLESLGSPKVYLDNWALYRLVENVTEKQIFVEHMNRTNGTLRVSLINIAELYKRKDKDQIDLVLQLFDLVDTSVINGLFEEVVEKENLFLSGQPSGNPSSDIDTVILYLMAQDYPSSFNLSNVFRDTLTQHKAQRMHTAWEALANKLKVSFAESREKYSKDKIKSKVKNLRDQGPLYETATRELAEHAFWYILLQKDMKLRANDYLDLHHMIVPTAYCDHVLIDSRWVEFLKQTQLSAPTIARYYSEATFEIFLDNLMAHDEV